MILKSTKGSEFTHVTFSLLYVIFILMLMVGYLMVVSIASVSKAYAHLPVDISSSFAALVETCFKNYIIPENLKSCVVNLKEKLNVRVTDMFTMKKYEASNTGLLERFTLYSGRFSYPVKIGDEIHPAIVEIEIRRFTLPWFYRR